MTSAPPPAPKKWDVPTGPCVLLTEEDVTAALGVDPGPGRSNAAKSGLGQCIYGAADGVLIQVVMHAEGKALFDRLSAKDLADGSAVAVSDVGEAANTMSVGTTTTISLVKGAFFIDIIVSTSGATSTMAGAIALAKIVAARL
jgi:hypothetical protein